MSTESGVLATTGATQVSAEGSIGVTDVVHYTQPGGEGMVIRGAVNVTAGSGTTAVALRCRKGNGLGGAVLGPGGGLVHTLAAGTSATIPFEFIDPAPVVDPIATPTGSAPTPGNQYTLSLQQTGGTGAGTVNYGVIGMTPISSGW